MAVAPLPRRVAGRTPATRLPQVQLIHLGLMHEDERMNSLLLAAAVAMVVRSLAAARLDRWNLGAPVVMVLAGGVVGLLNEDSIAAVLNT